MNRKLTNERLILVSGKGGVGKTSIAAALANLSAERGNRTILVTFDPADTVHSAYGVPLAYRPTRVADSLFVSRVDAFEAIGEYARTRMPFSTLYEGFFKSETFRDFAAAAPGFEELMCLGKLYELTTNGEFDRVIFDAPSSGHLKLLLGVPDATLKAVQVGPLNHNARKIQHLLWDVDQTQILIAALPEEMALTEAHELAEYCREERRMTVGPLLLNQVVRQRFSEAELATLKRASGGSAATAAAIAAALSEAELAAVQDQARRGAQGWPAVVEIPRVARRDDAPEPLLSALAESLVDLWEDR